LSGFSTKATVLGASDLQGSPKFPSVSLFLHIELTWLVTGIEKRTKILRKQWCLSINRWVHDFSTAAIDARSLRHVFPG
jgi:hypothetical protein